MFDFTLSLYDSNKKFNELAKRLIEDVLRRKFFIPMPANPDHEITLENIKTTEPEKEINTYVDKKMTNGSMVMRVYADLIETHKGKKVKTIQKDVLLGSVPYRTPVGTYLLGSDYSIVNQLRNKPGVYTTLTSSGDGVSAFQFGRGRSFKIVMSAKSHKFAMEVSNKVVPLIPLLVIFGFDDADMNDAFGSYASVNHADDWNDFYSKMHEFFFAHDNTFLLATDKEKNKKILDYMNDSVSLDEDNMKILTGIETKNITKELLKKVIKKTVEVYKHETPEDDRDSLVHNDIMTPSHLFADRLEKQLPALIKKVEYKTRYGKSIQEAVKNIIKEPLHNTVKASDLSRLDPQYNIMGGNLTGKTVTMLGEGAVSGTDVLKNSTRQYHPSHTGLIDPTFTPQGMAIGANLRAAPNLVVDATGDIKYHLKNIKTGRAETIALKRAANAYILLPGEDIKDKKVKVMHNFKVEEVSSALVTHELTDSVFADSLQLVPMVQGMQGPRGIMAATQFPQAVSLKNREAAHVIPMNPGNGEAADKLLGHNYLEMLGLTAPMNGTIKSIDNEKAVFVSDGGQERNIYVRPIIPLQYNTGIEITPKAKKGDKVKRGDPLFLTNFHDDDGNLAIGTHLKVMYGVDPRGYGVEDGLILSESAAKKLTSTHYYKVQVEKNPDDEISLDKVRTFFAHKHKPEALNKINKNGIVKSGSIVSYGDVLACKVTKYTANESEMLLGKLSRSMGHGLMDSSIVWDHFHDGEVKEVTPVGSGFVIVIKTEEEAVQGSKLTGRAGSKGTTSIILPDDQMPRTKDGPVDIILSPATVPSRVNPNQILETALGKISEKTGKRFILPEFDSKRDTFAFVKKELKDAGLQDKEDVFDPFTGKTNRIFVGNEYFMKLFSPEKDLSARGVLGSYDANKQPTKGQKSGSKAVGLMEFFALQSYNAPNLLKEFATIKSEKNLDFWRKYEVGLANLPKDRPYTFDKFTSLLTAAGAKVQKSPSGFSMVPLTDATTKELSNNRKITKDVTVRGAELKIMKDGLFDVAATGGLDGNLWSHIELEDAIPAPLLSQILRTLLGISKDDWIGYISSRTGDQLKREFDALDLDLVSMRLKKNIKEQRQLSDSVSALRFLENLKTMKLKLSDFIIKKLPVIPPKYRPMMKMVDGTQIVSDMNYLYKDVLFANKNLKASQSSELGDLKIDAKKNLIHSVDALVGLEETRSKALQEKGVKGIVTSITGKSSPKEGFFLDKMMKRQMILTGRARITPDPNLSMDEIGIPEFIAWTTFEPQIRKKLRSLGFQSDQISDLITKKDDRARGALNEAVKENVVLFNRAPTLHRFSMLAARPHIVPGENLTLSTFAEEPLNADYDGDAINVHTPVTAQAKRDAENMMLSKNLFTGYSYQDLVTRLDSEAYYGFYLKSIKEPAALKTWWSSVVNKGEGSQAIIGAEVSAPGLPKGGLQFPMDKKAMNKILKELALDHPEKAANVFLLLNKSGVRFASELGATIGMDDIEPVKEAVALLNEYEKKLNAVDTLKEKSELADELQKKLQKLAIDADSHISMLAKSGSKAKPAQIANILSSIGVILDPRTKKIKLVKANATKGYAFDDFLQLNAKGRNELIQTKTMVAAPGDVYKQLAHNVRSQIITAQDCGTLNGIMIDPNDRDSDAIGRLLASGVGKFPRNTPITSENIEDINDFKEIKVRSPLTCQADGLCAKCYGIDERGNFPEIGTSIGLRAVNSFSMAMSQKALDAKHSGRSVSEDIKKTTFESYKQLLQGTIDTPEEAVFSDNAGIVDDVVENDNKSHTITVDSRKYKIPFGLDVSVKKGDTVDTGMQMSTGEVSTKTIGNTLGLGHAAAYFTNILHSGILEPAGMGADRRNIEVVSRALYSNAEVKEPIGGFLPGDVIKLNEASKIIKKYSEEKTLDNVSADDRLGDYYLNYFPLDRITNSMKDELKINDIKKILVFTRPESLIPLAKGITTLPLTDTKNWIENMGYRFLKKNIVNALASGSTQKVGGKGTPITNYVSNIWEAQDIPEDSDGEV
ncbi:MAG: hypothetical protein WC517_03100 [Patescibacteria group bacterium]